MKMLHHFKQGCGSIYPFVVVKLVQEVPISTARVGELATACNSPKSSTGTPEEVFCGSAGILTSSLKTWFCLMLFEQM